MHYWLLLDIFMLSSNDQKKNLVQHSLHPTFKQIYAKHNVNLKSNDHGI